MALAIAAALAVGLTVLLHRGSKRLPWWIFATATAFVLTAFIVLRLQDEPGEDDVARAFRRGEISYNEYRARSAGAQTTLPFAAIAGGLVGALAALLGRAATYRRPET